MNRQTRSSARGIPRTGQATGPAEEDHTSVSLDVSLSPDPVGDLVRGLRAQCAATSVNQCLHDPAWCWQLARLVLFLVHPPFDPRRRRSYKRTAAETLAYVFGVAEAETETVCSVWYKEEALTYAAIRERIRTKLEAEEGPVTPRQLQNICIVVGALGHKKAQVFREFLPTADLRTWVKTRFREESQLLQRVSLWHEWQAGKRGLRGAAVFAAVNQIFQREFLQLNEEKPA